MSTTTKEAPVAHSDRAATELHTDAMTAFLSGDLLAPIEPAPQAPRGLPPAPDIDLGDGYVQPPLPGFEETR